MSEPVFLDVELASYDGAVRCDYPGCGTTSRCWKCYPGLGKTPSSRPVEPSLTSGYYLPPDNQKPVSWGDYPPKEYHCAQCRRYLPEVKATLYEDQLFCDECQQMRWRAHGG